MVWAVPVDADIYSWTDKNGVRHFTNHIPPPQARFVLNTRNIPRESHTNHAPRSNGFSQKRSMEGLEKKLHEAYQTLEEMENLLADVEWRLRRDEGLARQNLGNRLVFVEAAFDRVTPGISNTIIFSGRRYLGIPFNCGSYRSGPRYYGGKGHFTTRRYDKRGYHRKLNGLGVHRRYKSVGPYRLRSESYHHRETERRNRFYGRFHNDGIYRKKHYGQIYRRKSSAKFYRGNCFNGSRSWR
jgi:hypothetical protein